MRFQFIILLQINIVFGAKFPLQGCYSSLFISGVTGQPLLPRYLKPFLLENSSKFIFLLIILAGTPATIQLSGTSLTTTELAPIITLFQILIGPIMQEPALISTLSPMTGTSYHPDFPPMVTCCPMPQFFPKIALE